MILVFAQANAQNNITSSPYSLYGIGDPLSINNTMGLSMGDVKYAMDRPFYLNTANPASYASLKAPTFSLGAMLNRTRSFNSVTSQDNDNGTLRYFGLGIPITKKIGVAIGAKPFTSLGYGIQLNGSSKDLGDYITRYEGQGGMSIFHGGLGYELYTDSVQLLQVGANANFYFGNKTQTRLNNLSAIPGALNSVYIDKSLTSDFGFDLGLTYSVKLHELFNSTSSRENTLTLGGSYSIPTHLKTKFESFAGAFYYTGAKNFVVTDTLNYALDTTSIYLPTRYGIGLNYKVYNRHSKSMWIIEADYAFNGWSEMKINQSTSNLSNSNQYSFGLQYIPSVGSSRDFFKNLRYRAGVNYMDTRINILGEQLTDMSASMGFGIPLVKSKSVYPDASTFDFGMTMGSRGTTDNGLIREQYANIYIGLSFSPTYWDRWFKKRKIN